MATLEALLKLEADCIAELGDKREPWDYTSVLQLMHAKLNDPFGPTVNEIDCLLCAHYYQADGQVDHNDAEG